MHMLLEARYGLRLNVLRNYKTRCVFLTAFALCYRDFVRYDGPKHTLTLIWRHQTAEAVSHNNFYEAVHLAEC